MNPVKETIPYINKNCIKYGIEIINKDRKSDNFKFLIYGRPDQGKQLGIYDRQTTLLRLEKGEWDISGIEGLEMVLTCPKSAASQVSFSNFNRDRGVCVRVEHTHALKQLLDLYFDV
ncbi:MAG: hypothetical protein K9L22_08340 [Methylococcaceae bacterium]|nr:hypothetical protein [Methylococcaceae bacterium]